MNKPAWSSLWLRIELALRRVNPAIAFTVAVPLVMLAVLAWLAVARIALDTEYEATRRLAAVPAPAPPAAAAPGADQNLAHFYGSLGERRNVERQLKALFAIARKHGLVLRQGEYRSNYDRTAKLTTYQLNLPVTGKYAAIWRFALESLRVLPHAALDDVSFRRDAIGDANVEARLRMTLYLSARPEAGGAAR